MLAQTCKPRISEFCPKVTFLLEQRIKFVLKCNTLFFNASLPRLGDEEGDEGGGSDTFYVPFSKLLFALGCVSQIFSPVYNAKQKLWQKLGNPAGLSTTLNILLPSNIISAPPPSPNINVEVVVPSQTNTSRTTLKLGEGEGGGGVLKCHPFYSRIKGG